MLSGGVSARLSARLWAVSAALLKLWGLQERGGWRPVRNPREDMRWLLVQSETTGPFAAAAAVSSLQVTPNKSPLVTLRAAVPASGPCVAGPCVDKALTQNRVLDGALRVVEVHEELAVQVPDAALVAALRGLALDALQPGDQSGGGCQPHVVRNVVQAFYEFWGREQRQEREQRFRSRCAQLSSQHPSQETDPRVLGKGCPGTLSCSGPGVDSMDTVWRHDWPAWESAPSDP